MKINIMLLRELAKSLRVLYVEDEDNIRFEYGKFYMEFFKKVDTACNGMEALELYKKDRYDIVITDIKMPMCDGIRLAGEIKAINRKQPILVTSAYSDADYLLELINIGVDKFITKPINNAQLLDVLLNVCTAIKYEEEYMRCNVFKIRLAAINGLFKNIAHHWRNPLNEIGLLIQNIEIAYEEGTMDKAFLDEFIQQSMSVVQKMSGTIELFMASVPRSETDVVFELSGVIDNVLVLLGEALKDCCIVVKVDIRDNHTLTGCRTKLIEALSQIINNARDALLENRQTDRQLNICLLTAHNRPVIIVQDNGGGISEPLIEKIFEPYHTSKGPKSGTGLGLYIAQQFIETDMGGKLTARNTNVGAEFRIEL
ncbi:hybrid sensor histidine kinase/response regulator [Candidatus Magnetobacterium casense]|uniref:Hybrid sensor histidine kinase/response regulator n=1 Tax=Candidatus Magnetobacterium casense TaxID=1455061 RepID=A0ABS6S0H0_9BACT|nr:hybrid sensor histidine kinase/response regulator [Candidatus Magnetobacterium casensis]MBV6341889.1 hybrid sensor histidine kinase/response regulator [Candidatus Magnetobacterium casensis]